VFVVLVRCWLAGRYVMYILRDLWGPMLLILSIRVRFPHAVCLVAWHVF
jgi:hypothetical protein